MGCDAVHHFLNCGFVHPKWLLSAPKVVCEFGWRIETNFGTNQIPSFGNIVLFPSHFEVVYIDRQDKLQLFVNVAALPAVQRRKTYRNEGFTAVFFPKGAC